MAVNILLPHMRKGMETEPEPDFTTLDAEMARTHDRTHPHYDEADAYGNPEKAKAKESKADNDE